MKLKDLQEKIQSYDSLHVSYGYTLGYFRTSTGRHKRVQEIYDFYVLEKQSGKKDDDPVNLYLLTVKLIEIDKRKKKSISFIKDLRNSIAKPHFFEWMNLLYDKKILDPDIFERLYLLENNLEIRDEFLLFFSFFLKSMKSDKIARELQKKLLLLIINEVERKQDSINLLLLKKTFMALEKHNLLDDDNISKLVAKVDDFPYILWLVNLLISLESDLLKFKKVCPLLMNTEHSDVQQLLLNLYQNQELYAKNPSELLILLNICTGPNKRQASLLRLVNSIFNYDCQIIKMTYINALFSINDESELWALERNVRQLIEHKLLDANIYYAIVMGNNNSYLTIFLENLKNYPVFFSKNNINHFLNLPADDSDVFINCCSYFFMKGIKKDFIVDWLSPSTLPTIDYLIKNVLRYFDNNYKNLEYIVNHTKGYSLDSIQTLDNLFKLIKKTSFYNQNIGLKLFAVKEAYLSKMLAIFKGMYTNDNLNQQSYLEYLNKIKSKLELTEAVSLNKEQANNSSYYFNKHLGLHFFVPAQEALYVGGTGNILLGYKDEYGQEPDFIIKKLKDENPQKEQKMVAREVKNRRILGRNPAYYFQDQGQWCLMSDWLPGMDLFTVFKESSELIRELTFEEKIECILPLFYDLMRLHQAYRVHGDIKPENCIYDPELKKLTLIDFGSTRKLKDKATFDHFTIPYLDKRLYNKLIRGQAITNDYGFHDDVYSLGLVVQELLPYIELTWKENISTHIISYKPRDFELTIPEQAIYYLECSLLHENPSARCSAADAYQFLHRVLEEGDQLTKDAMRALVMEFLNNSHELLEDNIVQHSESPNISFCF